MVDFGIIEKEFKEPYVITGASALSRCGLILFPLNFLDLETDKKDADRINIRIAMFHYNPDGIDYVYDVTPSANNPLLLKPTKERALVECVKHLDWIDEGLLIEGLKSYLDYFWDDRIYEVAEHFGLDRETLDYWLEEARNDCEV